MSLATLIASLHLEMNRGCCCQMFMGGCLQFVAASQAALDLAIAPAACLDFAESAVLYESKSNASMLLLHLLKWGL